MKIIKLLTTALLSIGLSAVINAQCVANATVTPTSTPGQVYIEDFSTGSNIYSWVTFYDANNAYVGSSYLQPNALTAYYQFAQNGTYTYTVTVQDSLTSCTNSMTGTVLISGILPQVSCYAYFTSSNLNTLSPLSYTFNNVIGNNASTAYYYWDFGDGFGANGSNPTHIYQQNGVYVVCLYVIDSTLNGCSATFCDTINVNIQSQVCEAQFYSYDSTANNLQLFFGPLWNSSATATYYWNFGDGTTSTLQYPSHIYASAGNYTVCLIVNDTANGGCSDNYCNIISVGGSIVPNCNANFYLWQDSTQTGQYYAYNYSNGNALSYLWDFGDGNTSTNAYPSHIYQNAGTYIICLTVTDTSFGATCTSLFCDTLVVVLKATGIQLNVLQPGQVASVETENGVVSTQLYPNPTIGQFSIEMEANQTTDVTISLTNLVGQVIEKSTTEISVGTNVISFDSSTYPSGIYLVTITNNKSGVLFNSKLIKN
jgi:PKD repeat protein